MVDALYHSQCHASSSPGQQATAAVVNEGTPGTSSSDGWILPMEQDEKHCWVGAENPFSI